MCSVCGKSFTRPKPLRVCFPIILHVKNFSNSALRHNYVVTIFKTHRNTWQLIQAYPCIIVCTAQNHLNVMRICTSIWRDNTGNDGIKIVPVKRREMGEDDLETFHEDIMGHSIEGNRTIRMHSNLRYEHFYMLGFTSSVRRDHLIYSPFQPGRSTQHRLQISSILKLPVEFQIYKMILNLICNKILYVSHQVVSSFRRCYVSSA